MLRLDDPVSFITGATSSVRKAWQALGIVTVGDLLESLPRRYDDYSKVRLISDIRAGDVVTIKGNVVSATSRPLFRSRRNQLVRARVKDDTGVVSLTFFNQPWLVNELTPGKEIMVSGKVTVHPRYGKGLAHPLWEPAGSETIAAGKLAPVYGLSGTLFQKTYRRLLNAALRNLEEFPETLSAEVLKRWNLLSRRAAFEAVHEPKDLAQAEIGRRRLAFDELLAYQLAFALARREADQAAAPIIPFDERFAKKFVADLPFALTPDQKRAAWAALQDMGQARPMRRLLQGDVGSGKTVVAAFLAAQVQRAGCSVTILAPTEILARQHFVSLQRFFAPHQVPLALVTRADKRFFFNREEKILDNHELEELVDRGHLVLVGTHALLEARRLPSDLGLAIVDEQHRFGVEQREALVVARRADGRAPHFLSMTATPIPRSLALTLYGDLEVSVLREKPAGRLPIKTEVCVGDDREHVYDAIKAAAKRGEKSFVVCPLIDPSDVLGVTSVTEEWKLLTQGPLSELKIGLIHGRLKAEEKDKIMTALNAGELDVLVATAVIEVGVDVPKATVVAIEGAERFGLAQLHQIRGRVGRSTLPSRCFLLTDSTGDSLDRLKIMVKTNDGFLLAEEDLKLRGSGELFGTAQSGHAIFKAARMSDLELMAAAREEAKGVSEPYWLERANKLRETSHLE